MNLKPWREIIVPHPDVLSGTFQQSEFAADLTAVRTGKATKEYGDAKAFYERTFITEGMGRLLTQVAQRLNGKGGEPVIQLQTAFGGGKTHTMLAVYHMASRECALGELAGVPALLDRAGLLDVPTARIAVLDGNNHSPGQPWGYGKVAIHTLWGELAWQLGKEEGYALLKESDVKGTSPGKELLCKLLETYAPCVILMDELVAYIRQFADGALLTGGTFDSNISFIQALTEAAKLVPNAVVLASLPESDPKDVTSDSNIQVGGALGIRALRALENVFDRVQALWKTVSPEEAFEIVRRRLFQPIQDLKARDEVCRAFADAYVTEGKKLPQETQEAAYCDRMMHAYPIHPEVFSQLYEEWTLIPGFQRTRGVLKLMAKVIHRLWQDNDKDLMILTGSIPLYDSGARGELTHYLPVGWDPVVDKDIDGPRAGTTSLEGSEPRLGAFQAARRVGRAVFLGSAPSSVSVKTGSRGVDRSRILLGCLQPLQTSSIYFDALKRMVDHLHHLNLSGDNSNESTRYWFDIRANLRREMEERKKRFDDKTDVRARMADVAKTLAAGATFFDGVHIFTPHSDVPDDSSLRLVMMAPEHFYSKEESRLAFEAVLDYARNNGTKPRYRGNRLLFVAPDHATLTRLRDCIRIALAWESIVKDVSENRLVLDNLQADQAKKEMKSAVEVLPRVARECLKWLLCPTQDTPTEKLKVEAFPLNTSGSALGPEIERVCIDNELVISTWSPVHLRNKLKELYWKPEKVAVKAMDYWEDSLRYSYLSRLKDRSTLAQAIVKGAATRDFFGTAYELKGEKYEGFKFGEANVQLDDPLLLIEPTAAAAYEAAHAAPKQPVVPEESPCIVQEVPYATGTPGLQPPPTTSVAPTTPSASKPKSFNGSVEIAPSTAKTRLVQIAEEIIAILNSDPNATLKVTLEIAADFPQGAPDHIKRTVSENANALGFKRKDWE